MNLTGKAVRTLVVLFIVAAALVWGSRVPLFAEESNACGDLDDSVKSELTAADVRVELLLAAGNTAPRELKDSYTEIAHTVIACVAGDGRIELLPITSSGVGMAPVFSRVVPKFDPRGVPLHEQQKREQFLDAADAAIKGVLYTTKVFDHSDPLGTLHAAGDALHRSQTEGKRVVIVISNGWQQTKNINIFIYKNNPAAQADHVIDILRQKNALPNLAGTDVILTGFAMGDSGLQMTSVEMVGLCEFWKKIVRAGHGSTPLPCEQVLPGMTRPILLQRGERGLPQAEAAVVGRNEAIHPKR